MTAEILMVEYKQQGLEETEHPSRVEPTCSLGATNKEWAVMLHPNSYLALHKDYIVQPDVADHREKSSVHAQFAEMQIRSIATIFLLLILCLFSRAAQASTAGYTVTTEVYGTADDGTILHWDAYTPNGVGPWPAILVIHGGGFHGGEPEANSCTEDLANAGYVVFSIEYRLAPPGALPGQVSAGQFPDQTNDVKLAIRTARSDSRCNGQVGAVGGSAGGYHTAFAAATGTSGDDRLEVGVSLSGAYDLTDFSPNPNIGSYTTNVVNYVGVPTSDTASLAAASPAWVVDGTVSPLFLVNTVNDSMPYSQLPDMISRLDTLGVTNYRATTLAGSNHSFANWPAVKDSALEFLAAGFAGRTLPPPTPGTSKKLLNVSTRSDVELGEDVLVGGFIVTGDTSKKLVLRALGPSLTRAGLSGVLSDPVLQLYDSSGTLIESNDNWTLTGVPSDLLPGSPSESLLIALLPPGIYTAILSGVNSGSGNALFELYDVDPVGAGISNISTRGKVGTADNVIIGGFIVGGTDPVRVLVRGLGPSLGAYGVSAPLQDPDLELRDGNGALIGVNDNWRSDQQQEITGTGIAPSDNREAAILATLPPGNYTALVSGTGLSTGVSLVEIYDLENP